MQLNALCVIFIRNLSQLRIARWQLAQKCVHTLVQRCESRFSISMMHPLKNKQKKIAQRILSCKTKTFEIFANLFIILVYLP